MRSAGESCGTPARRPSTTGRCPAYSAGVRDWSSKARWSLRAIADKLQSSPIRKSIFIRFPLALVNTLFRLPSQNFIVREVLHYRF